MAKKAIWMEKTKFHDTLILIEEYISDIEDEMKGLRTLVRKFKNTVIYEEDKWTINNLNMKIQ